MKKTVSLVKNILLAFILISIGFALGKNYALQNAKTKTSDQKAYEIENSSYIHVYYFHSTFRCSTCNKIEEMTKKLLENNFKDNLNKREILFSDIDFQSDEKLAVKFGIFASCVVVAMEKDGKTVEYKRLDEVWTLIEKPKDFNQYISSAITNYLTKINQGV